MRRMVAVLGCLLSCAFALHAAAQDDAQYAAWRKLNAVRRANGAALVAWNTQLAAAAQRHAEDMASKGFLDELGSDGSTPEQRITAAGYPGWQEKRTWAELLHAGRGTFDDALRFFQGDSDQRAALLDLRFREVGIGIASDGVYTYWVVTLGAQPNVLPIFINDGDPFTNQRTVSVQLTQEEAMPQGDANALGRAIEVRLSERQTFEGAQWQRWEPLLPFTLSPGAGTKTLYAEFRDAAGRTAVASATIEYDPTRSAPAAPLPPDLAASTLVPPPPLPTLDVRLVPTPPLPTPIPTQPVVLPQVSTREATFIIARPTPTPPPQALAPAEPAFPAAKPDPPRAAPLALPIGDVLAGYLIIQSVLLVLFARLFVKHRQR